MGLFNDFMNFILYRVFVNEQLPGNCIQRAVCIKIDAQKSCHKGNFLRVFCFPDIFQKSSRRTGGDLTYNNFQIQAFINEALFPAGVEGYFHGFRCMSISAADLCEIFHRAAEAAIDMNTVFYLHLFQCVVNPLDGRASCFEMEEDSHILADMMVADIYGISQSGAQETGKPIVDAQPIALGDRICNMENADGLNIVNWESQFTGALDNPGVLSKMRAE